MPRRVTLLVCREGGEETESWKMGALKEWARKGTGRGKVPWMGEDAKRRMEWGWLLG